MLTRISIHTNFYQEILQNLVQGSSFLDDEGSNNDAIMFRYIFSNADPGGNPVC